MKATPVTNYITRIADYITREQLNSMNIGDTIYFTSAGGFKFRIKKTNESEKCFAWYCVTTKYSVASRCHADYILNSRVY